MGSIKQGLEWCLTVSDRATKYSQRERNQNEIYGYNGTPQIYDCTSFCTGYSVRGGWIPAPPAESLIKNWPWYTGNAGYVLTQYGFERLPLTTVVQPGDIVVRNNGNSNDHGEVVYKNPNGRTVNQLGYTNIGTGGSYPHAVIVQETNGNWTELYRPKDSGTYTEYNLLAICAMLGNFWHESGANPGIWEGLIIGAPGYGLGQWTDAIGVSRRTELFNWLDANNYPHDSGDGQLAFLIHENYWIPMPGYTSPHNSLQEFLNTTETDLDKLTLDYFHSWEGIDDGTGGDRIAHAHLAYDYLRQHLDDAKTATWISGNFYMSESQFLNNCLCIYRWMITNNPVTPYNPFSPDGKKRNKMKTLYYLRRF